MAKGILIRNGSVIEGNATPSDVLSGKTFMSENSDDVQTGTMVNYLQVVSILTGKFTHSATPGRDYYLIVSLNAQLEYWSASGLEKIHSHSVATGGGGAGTIMVVYKATKGKEWTITSNYEGLVVSQVLIE